MSTSSTRPLTKSQIEYASGRIHTIQSEKIDAFKASLPVVPEAPTLPSYSDKQKIAFIKTGKATLKSDHDHYGYLTTAFTYPAPKMTAAEQKLMDAHKKIEKSNEVVLKKFTDTLAKRVTKLLDQLHMGDSASTLALIENFAAEK